MEKSCLHFKNSFKSWVHKLFPSFVFRIIPRTPCYFIAWMRGKVKNKNKTQNTIKVPNFFQQLGERYSKCDLLRWKFLKVPRKREKLQESFKNRKPWDSAPKSALLVKAWGRPGTDLTQQRHATHSHRLGFRRAELPCFLWRFPQPGQNTSLSDGKLDYLKKLKLNKVV